MANFTLIDALAALAVSTLVFAIYRTNRKRSPYPLPPGPRKRFLIGNLLDLPTSFEWLTYTKWAKQYDSDIIHVNGAGIDFVILNTVKLAQDLLEKRSSNYSNRPAFVMTELMGWNYLFSSMPYGSAWRERRKLFQKHVNPLQPENHRPIAKDYIRKLLPELLQNGGNFMSLSRHFVGAITLVLAYGLNIKLVDDPFVHLSVESLQHLTEATIPGAFLVDLIPALRYVPEWVPGAGFQRKAREWKKLTDLFRSMPYEAAKQALSEGKGQPSFTSKCLDQISDEKNSGIDETMIRDTASMFFAGGSDTISAALYIIILALLCHPDKQAKIHEELDRVVGEDRLPDYDDKPNMPYLNAAIMEALRWRPITPISVPHSSEEDDVYNGYFIPKGSIMVVNLWKIMHDDEEYPEPDTYLPERHLDENGNLGNTVRDPLSIAFGFGRRICPGEHMARSTLFLTIASILSVFRLEKPVRDGVVIEPTMEFRSALVLHIDPYECDLKPRSPAAVRLITSLVD